MYGYDETQCQIAYTVFITHMSRSVYDEGASYLYLLKLHLSQLSGTFDNGVRIVNFATSKNLVVKSTMFPHREIHKHTWTSPEGGKLVSTPEK
jgi:hypothetical protein